MEDEEPADQGMAQERAADQQSGSAVRRLEKLPIGTRVVVRYRLEDGLTDALGELTGMDGTHCTVAARSGPVSIALTDIRLAKPVPPPPPRRRPRFSPPGLET